MNIEEIEKLADLLVASSVSEITMAGEGRRITLKRAPVSFVSADSYEESEDAGTEEDSVTNEFTPERATIVAPMVGVFHPIYPSLAVGFEVEAGQVVGTIESMKLMNDVRSEFSGTISAVLIEPGMAVEYGHPLFDLEPVSE